MSLIFGVLAMNTQCTSHHPKHKSNRAPSSADYDTVKYTLAFEFSPYTESSKDFVFPKEFDELGEYTGHIVVSVKPEGRLDYGSVIEEARSLIGQPYDGGVKLNFTKEESKFEMIVVDGRREKTRKTEEVVNNQIIEHPKVVGLEVVFISAESGIRMTCRMGDFFPPDVEECFE